MAETYTAYTAGVTFANGKSFMGIFNGVGSGKVIRLYRMLMLNNQVNAITGDITTFEVWTVSAFSGGSDMTVTKHDSTNLAINANVLVQYGATTFTEVVRLRRFVWQDEEPASDGATGREWECIVPLCEVIRLGYRDPDGSPIVLREGEGVHLRHMGTMAVGVADVSMEFTQGTT